MLHNEVQNTGNPHLQKDQGQAFLEKTFKSMKAATDSIQSGAGVPEFRTSDSHWLQRMFAKYQR